MIRYVWGSSGSACSRFVLDYVPVLVCPPSKVTFLGGTWPRRRVAAIRNFKTNCRQRARHVAAAPLGREGDYGVLRPSLILQFSSPQHLPSLPPSCQNRKSFHPKIPISLRPRWRGRFEEENRSFQCTAELDAPSVMIFPRSAVWNVSLSCKSGWTGFLNICVIFLDVKKPLHSRCVFGISETSCSDGFNSFSSAFPRTFT